MSFFSFLAQTDSYTDAQVHRLDTRKRFILDPFASEIAGARVLDLAAHDGRWSYALAAAGAARVVAVEARADVLKRYDQFPEAPFKARVKRRVGDIYDVVDGLNANSKHFDVVTLYGILYHVMDHMRLLDRIRRLSPRLIIIDSEFILSDNPMVQFLRENTDKDINATQLFAGQPTTMVGVPSIGAIEAMADVLGYRCTWTDWDKLPQAERGHLHDYFRKGRKRRLSCVLRPVA